MRACLSVLERCVAAASGVGKALMRQGMCEGCEGQKNVRARGGEGRDPKIFGSVSLRYLLSLSVQKF